MTIDYGTAITTLKGRKAAYIKKCDSFEPFSWLGPCSRVGGVEDPAGDVNITYKKGYDSGTYERDQTYRSAPGPSTAQVMMKETIRSRAYDDLRKCAYDLDVRTQNCKRADDPMNWDMIKRLCCATHTSQSTDDESSYSPDDEGETIVTTPMSSLKQSVIIYRAIIGQRVDEVDLENYYISRISACHSALCANPCDPDRMCKLIGTAIADTPSNPPAYATSVDGGRQWTIDTIPVFTTATSLSDIQCVGDLIVAVASGEPGYAVSMDAGATWALYDDSVVPAFAVFAPLTVEILDYNKILIGGETGYVWLSTDTGVTLTAVDEGVVTAGDVYAIRFADKNTVYASGALNTLKKSVNGGYTWSAIVAPAAGAGETITALLPVTDLIVLIGYGLTAVGAYYTTDGGDSFTRDTSLPSTYFYLSYSMCGCGIVFLAGTNDSAAGIVYRNAEYGVPARWDLIAIDDPGVGYTDVVCCGPNHAVAVGGPSGLYGAGVVTLIE